MKDNNGTDIHIGDRVVYIYCETVEFGKIVDIRDRKPVDKQDTKLHTFHIKGERNGYVTVLQRPTHLMVIK